MSVVSSLLEIEAKEACDWLRAAGFPQYAQLYEGKLEAPFFFFFFFHLFTFDYTRSSLLFTGCL